MDKILIVNKWPTEELIGEEELKKALKSGEELKHYIGFEISGKMHLGTGIGCMQKLVDLQQLGVECHIFLADYHAWINNKLGGNWDYIQQAAEYYKEGFKACIKALGGKPSKVKFIQGSKFYHNNDAYWRTVLDVAKNVTINRGLRSITILGRKETDVTSVAQLVYPPMQVADIFALGVRIAHAGMDQRKAHVLAREVADKLSTNQLKNSKGEVVKPILLHHHLWLGLQKPEVWPIPKDMNVQDLWSSMKMSKSKPKTAIFLDDSPELIREKIADAFCPAKVVDFNPVLDWVKNIGFHKGNFTINRPEKYGGDLTFTNYEELVEVYAKGNIHPLDLKKSFAEYLINFLEPVREHFKDKQHLIKMFDQFKITR